MAFERLLVPIRGERVLHFRDGLLVIDKPVGIPVHGGDESLRGDLVTRLGDWLRARGHEGYLGVHQRLDVGTSGALLFTVDRAQNAEISGLVAAHALERTYVAAVTLRSPEFASRLARGTVRLEHRLLTERGRSRVVAKGGVEARAQVLLRERSGSRALVELRPETGKTHQLRVQLSHEGAPVAGDREYGGDPAPRLLLHALELRLDAERHYSARLPKAFDAWLAGVAPGLGSDDELLASLEDAGILRAPLASLTDVYRLVNELGDGLPGVTVDRYADFALLSVSSPEAEARVPVLERLLGELGALRVFVNVRRRGDARRVAAESAAPLDPASEPVRVLVSEHGMKFWVELGTASSSGLFVDQRENRRRIRELAGGAHVLNLFSYTSSFGVAAAAGGAKRVVSVDVSRRALERARENFAVNVLDPSRHAFEQADALEWLTRARARGERFELVVLDPPSFASAAGGAPFNVRDHYAVAAERALGVLAPGGTLLAVTNHRKTSLGHLRKTLREAARRARIDVRQLKDLPSQLDCPEGPEGPVPSKSVLLTRA